MSWVCFAAKKACSSCNINLKQLYLFRLIKNSLHKQILAVTFAQNLKPNQNEYDNH